MALWLNLYYLSLRRAGQAKLAAAHFSALTGHLVPRRLGVRLGRRGARPPTVAPSRGAHVLQVTFKRGRDCAARATQPPGPANKNSELAGRALPAASNPGLPNGLRLGCLGLGGGDIGN